MPGKVSGTITVDAHGSQIRGGFHDRNGVPRHGWQAIFPIIQMMSDTEWRPIGTGFFISNNGLFATAKQVLVDQAGQPLRSLFGFQILREANEIVVREIIKTEIHPLAEVGIGSLFDKTFAELRQQTVNEMLGLTVKMPMGGERMVTYSFPNSVAIEDERGRGLNFASAASEGVFEEFHPAGRGRSFLPGPCIRTNMPLAFGSSGGPVAFGNGYVFAINSTGFDGSELSYLSPVSSLLELAVHNVCLLDGAVRSSVTVAALPEMGLIVLDK